MVLASLAGSGPVLELGIGTGRVAIPLAAQGLEVHGVDASPAMVEHMRAKPGGGDIGVTFGAIILAVLLWRRGGEQHGPPGTTASA